jgi:hypothetical protein
MKKTIKLFYPFIALLLYVLAALTGIIEVNSGEVWGFGVVFIPATIYHYYYHFFSESKEG